MEVNECNLQRCGHPSQLGLLLQNATDGHLFLTVLEAGRSRLRCQQVQVLERASPWPVDVCLLTISSHGRESELWSILLFLQGHQSHYGGL